MSSSDPRRPEMARAFEMTDLPQDPVAFDFYHIMSSVAGLASVWLRVRALAIWAVIFCFASWATKRKSQQDLKQFLPNAMFALSAVIIHYVIPVYHSWRSDMAHTAGPVGS